MKPRYLSPFLFLTFLLGSPLLAKSQTHANDQTRSLQVTVQSGNDPAQPLAGAEVEIVLAPGSTDSEVVARGTTNEEGLVDLTIPDADTEGVYLITAQAGDGVVLASASGSSVPDGVTLNELTTVATAYAFAQLFDASGKLQAEPLALRIADGMHANLVERETGEISEFLLSSPNADQTNSLRSLRSLGNLLAAAVRSREDHLQRLFTLATAPKQTDAPSNTLSAMVSIARHPAVNVDGIFHLSRQEEVYQPPLVLTPDAWTLAIVVNDSGSDELTISGTANTVFDDRGYAWINNNFVDGTDKSSQMLIVLRPDGHPARGEDGTPVSPVTGGGVFGPGFGITRSPVDGTVWVGNFGWGGDNPGSDGTGRGSVSHYELDGTPISGDQGYDGGTERVQGIVVDDEGNVWTANFGSDKIVVFVGGDPDNSVSAELKTKPFGLARTEEGTVWAATVGNLGLPGSKRTAPEDAIPSNVTHWRLNDDKTELELISKTTVGMMLKGLDVDYDGSVWVGSGGDDTVYHLKPDGTVAGAYRGGAINGPWSVRIDDAGAVWVANFGPVSPQPGHAVLRTGSVTKLAGVNYHEEIPAGTVLSPATGYTLPSAGEPVLMFDGTPLDETGKEPGAQPAFTPFQRPVSVVPDRAGNLWVSNNWKPNFVTNIQGDNPGGNSMIIFIGLAAPTEPGRTQ